MTFETYLNYCIPIFEKTDLSIKSGRNGVYIQVSQKESGFQLFLNGRPDGIAPFGYESYLDYFKKHPSKRHFSHSGKLLLHRELILYGIRAIALFQLKMFDLSQRDICRNLTSLMDIISWLQGDVTLDLFEELLNPNICMLFQSLAFQNTDKICEIFSPVIPVADDETFPVLNKTNVSFGKHDYN